MSDQPLIRLAAIAMRHHAELTCCINHYLESPTPKRLDKLQRLIQHQKDEEPYEPTSNVSLRVPTAMGESFSTPAQYQAAIHGTSPAKSQDSPPEASSGEQD